ncbi:helicase [Methylomagnum ishizawai]|nr:helicase [Methylomagnum ishizawai]
MKLEGYTGLGEIISTKAVDSEKFEAHIRWFTGNGPEWVSIDKLKSGFQLGMEVQDVPRSRSRNSLGEGTVLESRTIGGRDQVLVEFSESGQRIWIPFQNLRFIKGVRHRFEAGQFGKNGNAESFRLKTLAYALEMWNENTGALSKLDIDPLPHQIHLVHHILKSGNLNWLIADDVGLGKTIEVGMLLSALRQRRSFRRILLITPAGLVKQWKEEMHHKFGLSDFLIYGLDFTINDVRDWKHYDCVIGSLDLLKTAPHFDKLMQADYWDIIVFDEAHRLSRAQYGLTYSASERFRLAAQLRKRTDSILLLSATPHQGKQDKFQALLEIIRPEWRNHIETLSLNPELLREMVIRNHKSDVTDAKGEFIFRGKITKAVEVPLGQEEKDFDAILQRYLTEGYAAGRITKGASGRAIGFVMTIYRKLAASSIAAIEKALIRRLHKLKRQAEQAVFVQISEEEVDERFFGEWEEAFSVDSEKEFFDGELQLLKEVIERAQALLMVDRKIRIFIDQLIESVLHNSPDEKILVFSEYRGTQDYVATALRERFGFESVVLIHGGMNHKERAQAIEKFEEASQFLISTEAGGEGINLQRHCHIMVNFDLPWNPMRLVQRVGRLYRYGQMKPVVVFNVHAPQTLDAEIMTLMYQRIQQVVKDMAILGGDFRDGLEDEILGEIADLLEVEDILERATKSGINHTIEDIKEAVDKARNAVEKQRELFEYFAGYDPNETKDEIKLSQDHLRAFVQGMMRELNIELIQTRHQDSVWDLRIPEQLREHLNMGAKQRLSVTFSRELAVRRSEYQMMDFDSPLLRYMLYTAKSYDFDGLTAKIAGLPGQAIVTAILRWQNDQGARMRQEYIAALVYSDPAREAETNPRELISWLLQPLTETPAILINRETAKELRKKAYEAFDRRLSVISNADLHPESRQMINAAWIYPQIL